MARAFAPTLRAKWSTPKDTFWCNENRAIKLDNNSSPRNTFFSGQSTPFTTNSWGGFPGLPSLVRSALYGETRTLKDYRPDYFHLNGKMVRFTGCTVKRMREEGRLEFSLLVHGQKQKPQTWQKKAQKSNRKAYRFFFLFMARRHPPVASLPKNTVPTSLFFM